MPPSKSIFTILLALIFLFNRAQAFLFSDDREVIGYRTVGEEEAELINDGNKPYRDEFYDAERAGINQLGNGFYMTAVPAGWAGDPTEKNWYCVIEAEKENIEDVGKAWIPEFYQKMTWNGQFEEENLWVGDEEVIVDYIESLTPNPEKALRFSYISYVGWDLQMVIPTQVLNDDELELWAQCFESKEELLEYSDKTVDWESWGILGDPGLPSAETFVPMVTE
ncbi:uncharacterized protein L3040_005399 [Drepanopeziza brunnea f. sp. 'multigermtubi']|uniref:Uncharacterized protein n=1 Tax=Marssonina brunnea f. sp. multigermtubi (strain MB_m1) TaxID=1072389 RepID=K1WW06_MARBU|nr:uncharacterized protein MBM_04758 [Drepanopeziza brunnea f. sp. 'multigermtubi' MB_m1]EKD17181.1 hypothetical protein MBM_04758 [Drepanopeziza brunnea f. sp. 'multigermtubi' MB_m1]KAJ5041833.1 hypothetical protein L3040_005399 [Drepanopeziza brunnea f. sp. 'multigermtubi']